MFPKNNKKNKFKIAFLIFLTILFVFFLFYGKSLSEKPFFKGISKINLKLIRPFLDFKNKNFGGVDIYFKNSKKLSAELEMLRDENLILKTKILKLNILEKENKDLLFILGREIKKESILASIIFKPPFSSFDTFIIDAGKKEGITSGMKVFINDIMLGEISEAYEKTSKVRLYSYNGNEINVLVGSPEVSAAAFGKGGENFEIILAKDTEIKTGDKVLIPGTDVFILGEINKIERKESDPFKKAYFRYPINLNELKFVQILK